MFTLYFYRSIERAHTIISVDSAPAHISGAYHAGCVEVQKRRDIVRKAAHIRSSGREVTILNMPN